MPYYSLRNVGITIFLLFNSACSNEQGDKKSIKEADAYLTENIYTLDQRGFYGKLDSNLNNMYSQAQNNDYLLLHFYRAKMGNSVHLNKLDEGLLYSDSMEILFNQVTDYIKKPFEETYIDALCQKGNILFAQKKYFQAYDLFAKVTRWNKQHNRPNVNNSILLSVALGCYQQKLYDKALMYFQLQLENLLPLLEKPDFPIREGFYYKQQVYNNMGLSYTKLNKLDSASIFYYNALQFIDSFKKGTKDTSLVHPGDYTACKAVVYGNLAKVYALKKDFPNAIDTYKKAIYLSLYDPGGNDIIRDSADASLSLIQLGEIYKTQQDTSNLRFIIQELKRWKPQNAHGLGNIDNVSLGWLQINSGYYELTGNTQNELLYLRNYIKLKDSLEAIEGIIKEKNLLQVLELKSKEDELLEMTYKNKINTIYTWIVLFVSALITIAAITFYRSSKKEKKVNVMLHNLNTEIKHQQKETQFAFEQMEDANNEKDRVLQVVAHDLRNPLTGISTLADIILQEENMGELREPVEAIYRASKRSNLLVDELLQASKSKVRNLTITKVVLNDLLSDLNLLFKFRANEKNIKLELKQTPQDVTVLADAAKLERVIGNLLQNAIKFSRMNGEIVITLTETGNKAIITIVDKGIGMSEKVLASLSDAQASIVREGTSGEKSYGLGWGICQQVIVAHNGKLTVTSKIDFGTTITIELDAVTANA